MASRDSSNEMPLWKQEAIARFPEIAESWEDQWDSPYMCWIALNFAFRDAYMPPQNDDLIKRIYAYYKWCISQPRTESASTDLVTVVAVCFVEHIPENDVAILDLPRWMPKSEAVGWEQCFKYHGGDEGYATVLAAYEDQQRRNKLGGKSKTNAATYRSKARK